MKATGKRSGQQKPREIKRNQPYDSKRKNKVGYKSTRGKILNITHALYVTKG
jgi:hypothetical protein